MFVYIVVFSMAILSCYLANMERKKGHKKLAILLAIIAVVVPAILAGLRSKKIGTDVEFYLVKDYDLAAKTGNLWDYLRLGYGEPLFLTLVYIVTKIFGNFNVLLFVIQLLVMFFAYKACSNYKDKIPVFLSYAFFLFVYYNLSLNLIRQSVALMIAFFSIKYMMDGKPIKFLALVLVASLFHITALSMLLIGAMYWLTKRIKGRGTYYGIILFVIVGMLLFGQIIKILAEQGVIGEKYLYYIGSEHVDVSLAYIGFSVLMLGIILVFRKALIRSDKNSGFLIFLSTLNVILLSLSFGYNNAERLTYYFAVANIILIPQIIQLIKNGEILIIKTSSNEKIKRVAALVGAAYFVGLGTYHFVYYAVLRNHRTYPYQSNIIKMQNDGYK